MNITTTKDNIRIEHPTGAVQILTKTELQNLVDELQSQIDEQQNRKAAFIGDIATIEGLGG